MVRRGVLLVWLLRALALLLQPAQADVIFKVPEVMARPISGSKAVGSGPVNGSQPQRGPEPEPQYEEYFVEHDVSAADARHAAQLLNLDDIPETRVGCGPCSRRELEYCESRVLWDHCCCERRPVAEPLPWVPHTCYVGPRRCRPLARDCGRYARLRDCCCLRRLAERWRALLSGSPRARPTTRWSLVVSSVLALLSTTTLAA